MVGSILGKEGPGTKLLEIIEKNRLLHIRKKIKRANLPTIGPRRETVIDYALVHTEGPTQVAKIVIDEKIESENQPETIELNVRSEKKIRESTKNQTSITLLAKEGTEDYKKTVKEVEITRYSE